MSCIKQTRVLWILYLLFSVLTSCGNSDASFEKLPKTVDFNFHIRPILVQNCYLCHGPDPSSRKADLRLDTYEGATAALKEGGHAVIPGNPDNSKLIYRITNEREDEIMPPPETNSTLSKREIALIEKWIEYKILGVHLERIEDIVHQPSEIEQDDEHLLIASAQSKIAEVRGADHLGTRVQVEGLSFGYHSQQKDLFQNLNLSVDQGEVVAIVGTTGCGKTSLLLCLLGLITPTQGTITLNRSKLTPQTRSLFRIVAVMQDDQLLSGSIIDNISQFAEQTDINRVIKVAKLACIDDDIMAMTMQYQTLVGDMGDSLSGGQKQRILLARALYQKPNLLVLDEATSHLDVATEAQVCANLKNLNTTIIMVAHRPQTIAIAEKIYTLSSFGLTETSHSNDIIHPKNP